MPKRKTKRGGGRPVLDLTGHTYGRLRLVERVERRPATGTRGHWYYRAVCVACGAERAGLVLGTQHRSLTNKGKAGYACTNPGCETAVSNPRSAAFAARRKAVAAERKKAVVAELLAGRTLADIGKELGLTRAAVQVIAAGGLSAAQVDARLAALPAKAIAAAVRRLDPGVKRRVLLAAQAGG